jgi:hypothetical protein
MNYLAVASDSNQTKCLIIIRLNTLHVLKSRGVVHFRRSLDESSPVPSLLERVRERLHKNLIDQGYR